MTDISKSLALVEQVEKRRAEKIAQFVKTLREAANDPDLASVFALLRNGHHHEPQKSPQFVPPKGFKTGNGIRDAIRALTLPQEFTAEDVVRGLEAAHFHFASENRKAGAVRDALRALEKAAELRIKRHGKGGRLSVYERV
jgi:hypothetical protein